MNQYKKLVNDSMKLFEKKYKYKENIYGNIKICLYQEKRNAGERKQGEKGNSGKGKKEQENRPEEEGRVTEGGSCS